jgi:hypothetical protein
LRPDPALAALAARARLSRRDLLDASHDLPATWGAARERVLPAVRHRSYVEACRLSALADGKERQELPFEPVAGGIVTLLAYDASQFMGLPTAATQQSWGISLGEALAQAVANLERMSEPRWNSPARGVYVSGWQDDYDGSRILSERALPGLAVEGPMVAVIPDRNCLVVTGLGDVEAQRTALEFAAGRPKPRPVSSPGGHLCSRCVWTAGTVSLLPETDLIGLVDLSRPEGQQLLGWFEGATLRGRLGKLLEATDFYPIRYQVESFPSTVEIGAIRTSAPAGEQEGTAPVEMR